uniref:Uncharacterized protein n=1 Tax=Mastacembelus armatus TaxID=205130 RepID=A0A7N8X9K8_9TELE
GFLQVCTFKALRAKFQEEAFLAQSKCSRPAVAEKPKHLPPPGVHCGSINTFVENKTPVVSQGIFRDGLRSSGGKRPISFPPQLQQTSPSSQLVNGNTTTRQSLKERHMPLVLPVLSDHKLEPDGGKEVLPQTKIKKKGLLLPFKSTKTSKVNAENGEDPMYADFTTRPSSAPGELPCVEKQTTEDRVSLQSDQSTAECPLSSPDILVTPPSTQANVDSDNRLISTLERAKKKFSCRQMLISTKPKSLHSPDYTLRDKMFPSPPKNTEGVEPDLRIPPPVCLPHLACISARPFFKKPLPDLSSLGPMPPKPHRPPLVDLLHFQQSIVSPTSSQAPIEEPECENPSITNPVLDAPDFPDFESSEMEMAEGEAVDIAALELEALDLVSTDLPVSVDFGVTNFEDPQPHLSVCDPPESSVSSVVQDLNLGSPNIIPLDPEWHSPHTAEQKEQKKREKQRLEKEKKEQKEKEKKENLMKKKFKVTGDEEPMYHAKVMMANKVRKNDLPVKSGDTVGIIRTTNCPKGKWLARDANHTYGYISVMNVELNIKEMLELGKKAQAAGRGGNLEGDTISIGSSALCLIKLMCFSPVTDDKHLSFSVVQCCLSINVVTEKNNRNP